MGTAITTSHIERESAFQPQTGVETGGSAGNGWLFQEITKWLPGRGLGNLDVATLTRLLQEAERIMANTSQLLRGTTDRTDTPLTLSRNGTERPPKRHPKAATST